MLHYNPRHVSSINMPIFRRKNCIITASGIVTLCKRLHSMPVESRLHIKHELWCPPTPHFIRTGLLLSRITYTCGLGVLCPVRRPMTTLDLVMLNEKWTVSPSKTLEDFATHCSSHGSANVKLIVSFFLSSYIYIYKQNRKTVNYEIMRLNSLDVYCHWVQNTF